jgi:hypothetical protein
MRCNSFLACILFIVKRRARWTVANRVVKTIAMGHQRQPRFLTDITRDFSEVKAVLANMIKIIGGKEVEQIGEITSDNG